MHSLQTRRWLGICPRGGLRWLRGAYYTPWQWWKACARRCPGNANAQTWSLSASFFQRSPAAPLLIFYPPQNFSPQTCSFCLHCTISIPLGARLHPCAMWDNLLISNTDFWWWRSFLDSQLGGKILCHFIENIKMQGFNLWAKNSWLNRCRWGRKRSLGTGRFIGNLWSAYGLLMVTWWSLFWQFWSRLNHSPAVQPVWESCSTLFAFEKFN